ncbi:MAG: Gfo/Idh/MocA family oxidoreductase [Anaerolineae bacterium]|nr:Gfo/Idh/MocA family oxidoreductase [Anaerolineae bacterium]
MADQVRVGVIGTSWFADLVHLPTLKSNSQVHLAAICGRNKDRADEMAQKYGIASVYTDYREMIDKGGLDAVLIVVPDNLHYEMTLYALDAKLHVLCEKPLASSATEAREMYEKAESAGVKHMTFFTWRWQPSFRYAKQLIETGYVGRCYDTHIRYLAGYAHNSDYSWRFDKRVANGTLGDLGSHAIDFARHFVGEIKRVSCHLSTFVDRSANIADPANDSAVLALEFVNGAHGTLQVSAVDHLPNMGHEQYVHLYGEAGTLELNATFGSSEVRGARRDQEQLEVLSIPDEFFTNANRDDLFSILHTQPIGNRLFIEAILEDKPLAPSFYDGWKAQQVIDAGIRSHETGRWVEVGT